MPWTATFAANFEPFDRQLDQASASLGQFEQDTKKVERSLQRMVSEFDGTKVSQQAQSMAAAVDKIGGAAKLTEAEQRKLNATVTEAMAKYRSLGVEATPFLPSVAESWPLLVDCDDSAPLSAQKINEERPLELREEDLPHAAGAQRHEQRVAPKWLGSERPQTLAGLALAHGSKVR